MAGPLFYNQGDQDIYNSGTKFLPQEKYRLNKFTAPTAQIQPVPTSSGITNTNAFNNGGSGFSVYNPDPSSIVNRNYDPYSYRNAAENSYLPGRSNATDPKYLNQSYDPDGSVANAQDVYNKASGYIKSGLDPNRSAVNKSFSYRGITDPTLSEMQTMADGVIMDNRQNYGARGQYETVDSPLAYSSETELNKFKDNYPEFYNKPEATGIEKAIGALTNFIPGKGIAEFLGSYAPPNRRSMMENELSGKGVMVNNIGQIVQGGGAYDTSGNVMAGYNANKLTAKSFDDRIASLGKMSPEGKKKRTAAIEKAKADFLDAQARTDLVFEDEEAEKNKKKNKNFLARILKRTKINRAAKNNQDNTTTDGDDKTKVTGPTTTNDGGDKTPGTNSAPKYTDADVNRESYRGRKDGGRIGYFFGGRVNFKDGGLASIL